MARDRKIIEHYGVQEYSAKADFPPANDPGPTTIYARDINAHYKTNGAEWIGEGYSDSIAEKPSVALFGKGTWHVGADTYSSDGVDWFHNVSGEFIPSIDSGTTSTFSGIESSTARGATFNGWGYTYLRDNLTAFDTVTIKEIKRATGLTGTDLWSTIKVEVVDMSNESSAAAFFPSATVIASSIVSVNPSVDILSNVSFPLLDPLSRPIVLNGTNLPQRFGIRYSAYNAGGTNAVCGDNRVDTKTPNTVGVLYRSTPARAVNATATAGWYKVSGVWQQVNSATFKGLDLTLSLSNAMSYIKVLEPYGRFNISGFKASIAKILDGQTVVSNVVCLGDSWANNELILARPLARKLRTLYGDAGPGYTGFSTAYTSGPATGNVDTAQVTVARTGTWVTDSTSSAKGIDGFSISSATIGDSIAITLIGTARRAVLHYYAQVAGGDVRWKVDAGAWTTISTAAATAGMATAAIDFGADVTGVVVTIEVLTANVILHGIDLKKDTAGVRVHKLGHSGGMASTITAIDEVIGYTQLAALAPDLAFIVFTTNELYGDIAPSVMIDNIKIIVQRIKEVRPYCDIVLICPSDNAIEDHVYKHSEYESAMYQLGINLKCAFYPCKTVIGIHGDYFHNGLVADTVPHPNSAGGELLGRTLVKELLEF